MAKDYGAAVAQKGYDVKTCADRFLAYSSAFQNLKIFNVVAVSAQVPADVGTGFDAFTVATNDILTSAGHGLVNGNKIKISDGSLTGGAGLNDHDIYYVVQKTTDTFKVSLTLGGTPVNVTSAGDGYWETAPNRITIDHALGYLAPFFVIFTGSDVFGRNKSYFFTNQEGYSGPITRQYANKLEIDIGSWDGDAGDTQFFTVFLFLDDFSTIAAKDVNSGTSNGASSVDYGIRISKTGYDVKTCTDEQCVFSSSFFNQIVHMKGITTAETINHGLGYPPNFVAYYMLTDASGDYIAYSDFFVGCDATLVNFGVGETYYIIFKDKLT
jgi:hypothetical protein